MRAKKVLNKSFRQVRDDWREEIVLDPEIGGRKLHAKVIPSVTRLLEKHLNRREIKRFREAMDVTGAGDNPTLVRFLYRLAQKC